MENIHLPKMPKIHKPAFLKKKKSDEGTAAAAEGDEEAKESAEQDNKADEEKEGAAAEGEAKAEGGEDKPPGFFYNIKVMKKDFSSFLSKKSGSKDKDPEAGEAKDDEESKELLEKKDDDNAEDKEEKKDDNAEQDVEKKEASKGPTFLDSLRNVASQVPSMFKKTDKKPADDADVEAGEKDELLEEGKEGKKEEGDLEEVKVVEGEASEEKKDPEKAEQAAASYTKYLNQLKEGKNVCQQKYEALDRSKQLGVLAVLAALFLFLFILIIVGICAPSNWTNYSRITQDGQYVLTHTTCGPIQGLVEGHDQFSFKRIPYAVPVLNTDRWTHSRPMTSLTDCHEGTLIAHSHNSTGKLILNVTVLIC